MVTARATGDVAMTDKSIAVARSTRQRVFSGILPTGNFHLGNYLGAIRNWVDQQAEFDNVFCIVDLHALSLPTTKESLRPTSSVLPTSCLRRSGPVAIDHLCPVGRSLTPNSAGCSTR